MGVVGRRDVESLSGPPGTGPLISQVMRHDVVVAYPDETLRSAADRMSHRHVGVLPVVDRSEPHRLLGLVTQFDLLRARDRLMTEERHRERVLRVRPVPRLPWRVARTAAGASGIQEPVDGAAEPEDPNV
jgi:CBS domain-containing protein